MQDRPNHFVFSFFFVLFVICMAIPAAAQEPEGVEILPTKLTEKTRLKLPATVSDVKIGGDGRYLLLHFKQLRKIGLLDVNESAIVHYFPANEEDTVYDASLSKLVVASGSKGIIARYDLSSHERELTQTIETGTINHLLIGSATEGPIYIGRGDNRNRNRRSEQIDMTTLQTSELAKKGRNSVGFGAGESVRLSANGETFGLWRVSGSPSGLQSTTKTDGGWWGYYEHATVGVILPSPDGRTLYTSKGIYTDQLKRKGKTRFGQPFPAVHGDYYLNAAGEGESAHVSLHLAGESRPLVRVPGLAINVPGSRSALTIDKRVVLIPRANLIVHIPDNDDSLYLHPFDLEKSLNESRIDFLFVRSKPPVTVSVNEPFSYQLDVRSKAKGLKYQVSSGPKGMKISKKGRVTWSPTAKSMAENQIIISIVDAKGQEVFQTFNLKVPGGAGSDLAAKGESKQMDSKDKPLDPSKLNKDTTTIKLPATVSAIAHGGAGRYMLLHFDSLKKIGLFDVGKRQITHYFPATDDDTQFTAGLNHLLIASPNQGVISRYSLKTFERELTQAIPVTGKMQYLTMGSGSMGPALMRVASGTDEVSRCKFEFLDLKTLGLVDVKWERQPNSIYRDYNFICSSTIGGKFVVNDVGPISILGKKANYQHRFHRRTQVFPSFDGSYYVSSNGIFNADMQALGKPGDRNQGSYKIPAVMGNYYLSYPSHSYAHSRSQKKERVSAKLFMFGEDRPLATLADMELPYSSRTQGRLMVGRRVMFVPNANVIVTLAETNDRLFLTRFNINEALEESGIDYLIVMSNAPSTVKPGSNYEYQLDVKSKKGGLKYKIDSGPQGMTISKKGRVSWRAPQKPESASDKVILSIKDSADQEVFHVFTIDMADVSEPDSKEEIHEQQEEVESPAQRRRAEQQRRLAREREPQATGGESRTTPKKPKAGNNNTGSGFELRDWTDSTGQFKMRARFIRIEGRSTVVLNDEKGKEVRIPLQNLSGSDVYEAVKSDLLQNNLVEPEPESPFKIVE